ncbi:MAG: Cmr6 family CRISPR-associated RAMP protein, partial [Candidatus Magnetoglobus multicellularis str. Araruama]
MGFKNQKSYQGNKHSNHDRNRKRDVPTNAGLYYYSEGRSENDGYGRYLPQYSMFDLLDTNEKQPEIHSLNYSDYFKVQDANQTFPLKTHYPGLIIGIGYVHAVAEPNDFDFQQGFFLIGQQVCQLFLDRLSRASPAPFFPQKKESAKSDEHDNIVNEKCSYINFVLNQELTLAQIRQLETQIYETKGDIFYDAYIIPPEHGKIFAEDYITHHPSPFKEPIPLRHLKIATGITFQFQFR